MRVGRGQAHREHRFKYAFCWDYSACAPAHNLNYFLGIHFMLKKHELTVMEPTKLDLLTKEEAALVSKELVNVREEVQDCPYLGEALKVLPVRGYRSAIGAYWNAVVDDLRQ